MIPNLYKKAKGWFSKRGITLSLGLKLPWARILLGKFKSK